MRGSAARITEMSEPSRVGEELTGRSVGRYRIESLLGCGGMASVWTARDTLLGRDVAFKVLAPSLAESVHARHRFRREAQLASRLDHPGVAAVYDAGEIGGITFIAMTLIDGETLAQRVERSLLPVAEAVRIVRLVAAALGYAHDRGVIHRDVTSRNIMLARDGRVLVLDFGLAIAAGGSRITSSNTLLGTASFVPPEVLMGEAADVRGDLYSLGVVFYHALTGALPFQGHHPEAARYETVHADPEPPSRLRPEVPPELDRVVARAMARDPLARYSRADELMNDLRVPMEPSRDHAAGRDASGGPRRSAVAEAFAGRTGPVYLALLPFRLLDASPELATMARDLNAAVAAALARPDRLHVILPGEDPAPPAEEGLAPLARRTGANLVLQGTLREAGSRVSATYALIDPIGGETVAGDVVEGSRLDPYEFEQRLATSLRRVLGISDPVLPVHPPGVPRDPAASEHFHQALAYLERYDHEASVDGAIELLERLAASEGTAAVHAALTRAYLFKLRLTQQQAWRGRAAAACEEALRLDPQAPEVRVAHGDLLRNSGHHAEALVEYRAASSVQPDLVEAHLGEAQASQSIGDFEGAAAACRRAIALRPDDWRGHYRVGSVYYTQGNLKRALAPWRRVLRLTPDNGFGYRNLGSALFRLDRLEEAVDTLRRGLVHHQDAHIYASLGAALFFLRRYQESLEVMRRAANLRPSDPFSWGNLGSACRWIEGAEEEGREALARAIGLMTEHLRQNPADAAGWSQLAGWHTNLGQGERAMKAVERALELAPGNADCMAAAGHACFHLGDRARALEWFRKAVRSGYGPESLRRAPELAPLMEDPEFKRILDRDTRPGRPKTTNRTRGGPCP